MSIVFPVTPRAPSLRGDCNTWSNLA